LSKQAEHKKKKVSKRAKRRKFVVFQIISIFLFSCLKISAIEITLYLALRMCSWKSLKGVLGLFISEGWWFSWWK